MTRISATILMFAACTLTSCSPAAAQERTELAACYKAGERNQGATGHPRVHYKPCCDGQSAVAKTSHWGKFCPGSSPRNCYGKGERNQGAAGRPFVQYKPCCDGQSAVAKTGDWGKFCPGTEQEVKTDPGTGIGSGGLPAGWHFPSTTYGAMTFTSPMAADYTYDGGSKIEGTRWDAETRTLSGIWSEPSSGQRCNRSRGPLGTLHWGEVRFVFSKDFITFTGFWDYCDEAPSRKWVGSGGQARDWMP